MAQTAWTCAHTPMTMRTPCTARTAVQFGVHPCRFATRTFPESACSRAQQLQPSQHPHAVGAQRQCRMQRVCRVGSSTGSSSGSADKHDKHAPHFGQGVLQRTSPVPLQLLALGLGPPVLWALCWLPTMGLVHAGYAALWAMSRLTAAVFSDLGAGGAGGGVPLLDFTDLALRTAATLAGSGREPLVGHSGFDTAVLSTLLPPLHAAWQGCRSSAYAVQAAAPWALPLAHIALAGCAAVFLATMTPARPLLARWLVHRQHRPNISNQVHDKPAGTEQQASISGPPAPSTGTQQTVQQAAAETWLQAVGGAAACALMVWVTAQQTSAPPLTGSWALTPGTGLFALGALVCDVVIPIAVLVAAGKCLVSVAVSAAEQQEQADGRQQGVWADVASVCQRTMARVCALAACGCGGLTLCVAAGLVHGHVTAIRVVGCALLARVAWVGLRSKPTGTSTAAGAPAK